MDTSTCSAPFKSFKETRFARPSRTGALGVIYTSSYDWLGSSQVRGFQYSTLGRLLKASNPETAATSCNPLPTTGIETYTYDANGNVLTKMDARGYTTKFPIYDGLNRPTSKSYLLGNQSADPNTPAVSYSYDQDWKGALSSVSVGSGTALHSTSYIHDTLGRVKSSTQTIAGVQANPFQYTMTLADQVTGIQYPTGRQLNFGGRTGTGERGQPEQPSEKVPAAGVPSDNFSSLNALYWQDAKKCASRCSGNSLPRYAARE